MADIEKQLEKNKKEIDKINLKIRDLKHKKKIVKTKAAEDIDAEIKSLTYKVHQLVNKRNKLIAKQKKKKK